ncbi:MAG: hypothetical protein HRT44_05790 [Bdellovibrionales bacterium]|nr:LysR substrate-binding domain-containing protein [Bdellovibrionales bacterium]NQZ18756.1 hypothetical protein [Bdellovibrionales bacterium]
MPHILASLNKKAPNISLRLIRWNPPALPAQMTNSMVDFAIGVSQLNIPNLMQRKLYDETFVCATRSNHPILKTKKQLEDFLTYPHTMTSSGDRVKGVVDRALEKINRKRNLTHTVSNFSSAPYVIENSDCIITAPRRFITSLEKRHKLKTFEPPLELPNFSVKLFWIKKNQNEAGNKWMRDFLYDVFNKVSQP